MPNPEVVLKIGNKRYKGVESATIAASMETCPWSFSASISERLGDNTLEDIKPNEPISIGLQTTNGIDIPMFTGYIDTRHREIMGEATTYEIGGRSKTGDLVDCSAFTKKTTWRRITFPDLCRQITKPFGIKVVQVIPNGDPIRNYTAKPTSTAFSTIEELSRQQGALPLTNEDGDLVLEYATPGLRSEIDLVEGEGGNVKGISEDYNMKDRFSEYIVRGQGTSSGGAPWDPAQTTQIQGKAEDEFVPRYRPKVIMAGSKITTTEIRKRAKWEAQTRAGRSLGYNVKVKGWLQGESLVPWKINSLVNLTSKSWGINSIFLVVGAEFSLDNTSGQVTTLALRYQSTYSVNPTGGIDV